MNNKPAYAHPQLGATFYPGGIDDFQIPELAAPAPQRPLQEVPNNITDNLAHLELEANSRGENFGYQSPVSSIGEPLTPIAPLQPRKMDQYGGSHQSYNGGRGDLRYSSGNYSNHGSQYGPGTPNLGGPTPTPKPIVPSPFPPLHNRPGNVPPSSEERETILENARDGVLNSNDPEMQLVWAQDVLAHVDISIQNDQRTSEYQAPRSRTPPVEHQLRVEALNVVKFLADQHHPQAEFMRGKWLEFGKFGYPVNLPEAYRAYSRAAQNGYSRAEYRMGTQFENSGDAAKAVHHYSLGVNAGDSASCYRLGMMTLLGQQGQRQDYARGIDLVKFAADCSDEDAPQGAYVYGMLLARELPQVTVPDQYLQPDINAARFYIEKAAFLGFAKAQSKMGAAYELSQLNCHFDPVLSLHYSNLAARQGDPEAEMAISKWFLCGHEEIFRKNEDMAFNYAQRAANAGLATAEFALGYFHEVGISVPVNLKEAQMWYRKSAAQGNKDAAARVEGISRSKTLSRKDHDRVAVAKIQSTHGSQHQNSGDRFTSTAPTPNEYLSMPDINFSKARYGNGNYGAYSPTSPGPGSGSFSNQINSPSLGYGNQPPPRPTSSTSIGRTPLTNEQYRVSSSTNQHSNYSQSPIPTPRPANFGPNQRVASGPSNLNSQPNQRPGLPSSPAPSRVNDSYQSNKPLPPLGFVAPADPTGADRIRRAQRNDDPRPPGDVYGPPRNSASRPSASHSTQSYQQSPRPSDPRLGAGTPSNSNRPPRVDSAPQRPSSAAPSHTPSQAASASNSAASKPPVKKPGKGPATFEEMGVPQGKKEEDCAIDITANLHNKVTKTNTVKLLKELHEKNLIAGKAAGKQIVYHALQTAQDHSTPEGIAAMDLEIATLREEVAASKAEEKAQRAKLSNLSATIPTSDLRSSVQALEAEKEDIIVRLASHREGKVEPISSEEKSAVDKDLKSWGKHAAVRRKFTHELFLTVHDMVVGKTREELWEEIGLEDE